MSAITLPLGEMETYRLHEELWDSKMIECLVQKEQVNELKSACRGGLWEHIPSQGLPSTLAHSALLAANCVIKTEGVLIKFSDDTRLGQLANMPNDRIKNLQDLTG